jgi:hypothetical protein
MATAFKLIAALAMLGSAAAHGSLSMRRIAGESTGGAMNFFVHRANACVAGAILAAAGETDWRP